MSKETDGGTSPQSIEAFPPIEWTVPQSVFEYQLVQLRRESLASTLRLTAIGSGITGLAWWFMGGAFPGINWPWLVIGMSIYPFMLGMSQFIATFLSPLPGHYAITPRGILTSMNRGRVIRWKHIHSFVIEPHELPHFEQLVLFNNPYRARSIPLPTRQLAQSIIEAVKQNVRQGKPDQKHRPLDPSEWRRIVVLTTLLSIFASLSFNAFFSLKPDNRGWAILAFIIFGPGTLIALGMRRRGIMQRILVAQTMNLLAVIEVLLVWLPWFAHHFSIK